MVWKKAQTQEGQGILQAIELAESQNQQNYICLTSTLESKQSCLPFQTVVNC